MEQIARFTPDPPVPVQTHEIPTVDDPSRGYLVVHVPASPLAPHMVDGRYLGRGDATNQRLSDSEVLRLHEQRRIGAADALVLLDREIARDPAAEGAWEGRRRQVHLFVVASPLAPRPEMLLSQLKDANVHQLVRSGGYGTVPAGPLGGERFSPDLSAASRYSRRADGTALSTDNVLPDRMLAVEPGTYRPEDLVDVEFGEDGAIRVVMTRLSDVGGADSSEQQIFDVAAVVYVRRVMAMAIYISDLTGYHGGWQLAVGATGLKGMFPSENSRNMWGLGSSYAFEDDEYRNARVVSYTELLDTPGALTMALLGKFLRKLGTENRHADLTLDTVFGEGTDL